MSVHFAVKTADDYIREAAEAFQFPGREWHLRNIADVRDPGAVWIADVRGASTDELMQAALFADVAHQRQAPFVLLLPYLPAARADRAFLNEQPVGVAAYSSVVNAMNPQQVIGIDAHSPIVYRYMQNLTELDLVPLLERAVELGKVSYDAIIAPDKGALGRASNAAQELGIDYYCAAKQRDEATGKILGIQIEPLPAYGTYLVVDDICDGGGTFMGLAEATKIPTEQLGLWVTHGIFSGNATNLRLHYRHIYTTDSHPGHGRVGCATSIVPCEVYMLNNLKEFG